MRKPLLNGEDYIISPKKTIVSYEQCCDCGLVHMVVYEVDKSGAIHSMAYRDDDETEKVRKKDGIVVYKRNGKGVG